MDYNFAHGNLCASPPPPIPDINSSTYVYGLIIKPQHSSSCCYIYEYPCLEYAAVDNVWNPQQQGLKTSLQGLRIEHPKIMPDSCTRD